MNTLELPLYLDSPKKEKNKNYHDWKALRLFNFYRIFLSTLFISFFVTKFGPIFFGRMFPDLFLAVSAFYLLFTLFTFFVIHYRWWTFNQQVILQTSIDIFAISLLMYASGGVNTGLGMLLVVTIAGGSILTRGRTALFFAALASMTLLISTTYINLMGVVMYTHYTQAGILGASFFATALLAHALAQRIRSSEKLANQRGLHLHHLSQLNTQIVENMQSGIIVIDDLGRMCQVNKAAQQLLNQQLLANGLLLKIVCPELAVYLANWVSNPENNGQLYRPSTGEMDILLNFNRLHHAGKMTILIVLEDATLTTQRAQQLKLASLGRLTASIAHEVRNPLGAISHASQLLAESSEIKGSDQRLLQIIGKQCHRVNAIVESVLQLSRQKTANTTPLFLDEWLLDFIQELEEHRHLSQTQIKATLDEGVQIVFDPIHLQQVIWNLADNGLRYATTTPLLHFKMGFNQKSQRVYLDIKDSGQGMDETIRQQLFEPFFTSEAKGTGLGLYICREICSANKAALHLTENEPTGCCFRIYFSSQ